MHEGSVLCSGIQDRRQDGRIVEQAGQKSQGDRPEPAAREFPLTDKEAGAFAAGAKCSPGFAAGPEYSPGFARGAPDFVIPAGYFFINMII